MSTGSHFSSRSYARGFTLIELIVTLSIIAVLAAMAVPAFTEFRERAAIRGAADQFVTFWGNARFEAVKRNRMVKVGFVRAGDTLCLGAETTNNPADATICDCFTAAACNVGQYPADQGDWRGVVATAAPSVGGGSGVAVVDPKRGFLTQSGDQGIANLRSPNTTRQYQLRFVLDALGRAGLCEPTGAPVKLPEYGDRSCGS